MIRADLLALTPDALAALANRGLVKRAAKDIDAGIVPELTLDADGTLQGAFPDGVKAILPRGGGLEGASCTCAAPGVCRHRIGLVLAYRRRAAETAVGPAGLAGPAGTADAGGTGDGVGVTDAADPHGAVAVTGANGGRAGADPAKPEAALAVADPDAALAAAEGGTAPGVEGARAGDGTTTGARAGVGTTADTGADLGANPGGEPGRALAGGAGPGGHASGSVEPAERANWSPGAFADDVLVRALGRRALNAARRLHRAGYSARIHRPTEADPSASVELPACTVRFLVPGEIGYVHTDAAAAIRAEVITLAVWAFRAADEQGLRGDDVRVDVGGGLGDAAKGSGLESAVGLVDQVLLDGAMHAGPVLATALHRSRRELTGAGLHWPAAALDDLAGQLTAYRDRAAGYAPERLAALLAEIHARHRAARHDGGSPRSQVLGTSEPAETPLRQVRLTALGCRVDGGEDERTAEIYLAHADGGIVLALERRWEVQEGQAPTGRDLATRRISGAPLGAFATANIVSENASRTAGRAVRMAQGRVTKTTVTPVGMAWANLPDSLLTRDLRTLDREMAALPPRLIRPRVQAELVRVVEVAEVRDVGYDPADQRLEATVADAAGTTATVSAVYSPYRPGALDCLAETLTAHSAGPLLISGSVRRARGALVLDPIAIMAGGVIVVPDLAPGDGGGALEAGAERRRDPVTAALDDALAVCAETAHRGLRHATEGIHDRLNRTVRALRGLGLRTAADRVGDLAAALRGEIPGRMTGAWVDACLHLTTAAELR